MSLQFISLPPSGSQPPAGLIVCLHGWGANAEDTASLAPFFKLPNYQFLFPNAPFPFPNSSTGRAWYDLRTENMYVGLEESRQLLIDWLQSLESSTGVPLSRTILSGFSQGGAMTLDVGLKLPLAGLVVMSGYLHPDLVNTASGDFPPTLIMHGTSDEVVPLSAALKTRQFTESLGMAVDYQEFDLGHEVSTEMLDVLHNFANNLLV
ncbi:alpha/beta hydrolase [Nodularia harveyana UHCC-0300]|uniref:Alpha/beta hydrolase n=1 Tax=Nodularia harveyana UHCC-0300 TaxID=2974287 RepID=A0ABU5UFZ5_9CYAN|nr:alpha/beta hydrolase [Nodularia harveyana]MEA5582461.1 alpha/beta hydrolase [Nodularia harveyana UHCC-0300]